MKKLSWQRISLCSEYYLSNSLVSRDFFQCRKRFINSKSGIDPIHDSKQSTALSDNNYRFVDQIKVFVRGGKGGDGCVSYESTGPGKKKPSGGSGGRGGNVFVVADKNKVSLHYPTVHFNAQDGKPGGGSGMSGKNGNSCFIKVPCGTVVSEVVENELWEEDYADVEEFDESDTEGGQALDEQFDSQSGKRIELNRDGELVLIAKGGKAGLGNAVTSSGKYRNKSIPGTKTPGQLGQSRTILLELKTIADVGLVGYPNAGKSSLLRALSNATPRVASYPFTTLYPTVGVVNYTDRFQVSVADIPGLIEGAHENRGLGHDFLKHIERTKILLFVIDMHPQIAHQSGSRRTLSPLDVLKDLLKEIEFYDRSLLSRPLIVFGNKYDLTVEGNHENDLKTFLADRGIPFLSGSALAGKGIGQLAHRIRHAMMTLTSTSEDSMTS